jgi:hypothetical protein
MYAVISDHPYYPSIEYFPTMEGAKEAYEKEIKDMESKDGRHDLKVSIVEIIIMPERTKYISWYNSLYHLIYEYELPSKTTVRELLAWVREKSNG